MDIPSWAELQRLNCPGLHGVVPVFMGVNVLSKLEEAMFGELGRLAGNHGSQAKRSRDAVLGRGAVEPESQGINKIMHEDTWDAAVYSDRFRLH